MRRLLPFLLVMILLFSGSASAQFFGGGGTAFAPSDISGLTLDIDALTGATFDTSVRANAVTSMRNQGTGGTDYTAAQSTEARKPTLVVDEYAGEPALLFDGTDDRLTLSGNGLKLLNQKTGLTAFIVYKPVTPTTNLRCILDFATSGGTYRRLSYCLNHSPNTQRIFYTDVGSYADAYESSVAVNEWTTEAIRVDVSVNPNKLNYWWNGVKRIDNLSFGSQTGGAYSNTDLASAAFPMYNAYGTASYFANIYLKRLLVYTRPLSDLEVSQVTNYLQTTYYGKPRLDYFVFIGDSNTEGLGVSPASGNVVNQFKTKADAIPWPVSVVVQNGGVSGQKMKDTEAYWEAVDRELSKRKFPFARNVFLIVGSGTNDIGAPDSLANMEGYYRSFGLKYSALGYKCFLWTTLPTKNMVAETNALQASQLANYSSWGYLGVINSDTVFVTQPTEGAPTAGGDWQSDGVHLAAQGDGKLADAVISAVRTYLGF